MTLPPERIGDKGQRYEVRALGWPKDCWSTVGWVEDIEQAKALIHAISSAPGFDQAEICDREENRIVTIALHRSAW
jgi:hypothetical protein